jgi:hypothetical protein
MSANTDLFRSCAESLLVRFRDYSERKRALKAADLT